MIKKINRSMTKSERQTYNLFIFHNSTSQALYNSNGYELYTVSDLWEVPEDAVIGRSLVSAGEIVGFIRKGMNLVKEGYDSIEVEYIKVPDYEYVEDYAYEFFNSQLN